MPFLRIAVLENEIEARLLETILVDRAIPHLLRSYHDMAYDGLFQASLGWGTIHAQEEDREAILALLEEIRNPEPPDTDE